MPFRIEGFPRKKSTSRCFQQPATGVLANFYAFALDYDSFCTDNVIIMRWLRNLLRLLLTPSCKQTPEEGNDLLQKDNDDPDVPHDPAAFAEAPLTSAPPPTQNLGDLSTEEAAPPANGEDRIADDVTSADAEFVEAEKALQLQITLVMAGKRPEMHVPQEDLLPLCKVIDYWISKDNSELIGRLGLGPLANEVKRDYVTASLLAWRGEFKMAYISLRSFIESFCILLYYLNQGCDRLLYLKGQGYKLMLHRMAQKRNVEDEHAFRRHYWLLLSEGADKNYANKFFEEVESCYGLLSKAVHGEFSIGTANPITDYLDAARRVLRICNTLALHDPMFDATDEDLEATLGAALIPASFSIGKKK